VTDPRARRRRRTGATASIALLVAATAACTPFDGGPATTSPDSSAASAPEDATTTTPEAAAPPPPARVRVTRVSGKLEDGDRDVLADTVEEVVTAYFDDAFVGGEYPRTSYGDAFDTFSAGAARQAASDRDLLTNRLLGPTTESVEVRRRSAYLSVLAPYKVAAGVTARVHLQFLADRGDQPAKLVSVTGRLMLTRKESGGWEIFGYDLTQAAHTVGEGS